MYGLEVLNEWKERLDEDVGNIRPDLGMGILKYFFDWTPGQGQDVAKLRASLPGRGLTMHSLPGRNGGPEEA